MIERVEVRRFQSLWDAELELGQLTVVTGPSNSGKSAFGRALRMLGRNVSSPGVVSHGAKTTIVSAVTDDGVRVSLERGSSITYKITRGDTEEVYAKAGREVPSDVADVFRMPVPDEGPDPHFTTQFDGPYLLNVPGSTAARVLGALTNVTILAEAAREANRRKLEASKMARIRADDSQAAAEAVRARFGNLKGRREAVAEARAALEACREGSGRAERLEAVSERAMDAQEAHGRLVSEAQGFAATIEAVGDELTGIDATIDRVQRLTVTAGQVTEWASAEAQYVEEAEKIGQGIVQAEARVHEMLVEAGECPTCQQKVGGT